MGYKTEAERLAALETEVRVAREFTRDDRARSDRAMELAAKAIDDRRLHDNNVREDMRKQAETFASKEQLRIIERIIWIAIGVAAVLKFAADKGIRLPGQN